MVRKTLLTPEEVFEVKQKFLKLSLEPPIVILHLKDALDCIEELKEKQIPLSGHDFYWLKKDGDLKQDGMMHGKHCPETDPEWITKVLEMYAEDIRYELERHPNGEMVVELVFPVSTWYRVNNTAAIPPEIRLSFKEACAQSLEYEKAHPTSSVE